MIGLIAAVTVQIVDTSIVDAYTAVLAIGAFAALNRSHGRDSIVRFRSSRAIAFPGGSRSQSIADRWSPTSGHDRLGIAHLARPEVLSLLDARPSGVVQERAA